MANTILEQLNALGAKLGYPFYVYPDGTFAKNVVVSDDAALLVQSAFGSKELNAEALDIWLDKDVALGVGLNEIGQCVGYPFYVYEDGTCDFMPVNSAKPLAMVMVVKKPLKVSRLKAERVAGKVADEAARKRSKVVSKAPKPDEQQRQILLKARALDAKGQLLSGDEELVFFQFASDEELEAYFFKHVFRDSFQKEFILRGDKRVLLALMRHEKISEENQLLMAQYCDDNVVLALAGRDHVSSKLVPKLQELGRSELVQAVLKEQAECLKRAEMEYRFW